jgi:hypothetical protein
MKIKHYKILTLLSIGFITSLTTAPALNDVHGALTAPASYDFNYQYSSSLSRFVIGTSSVGTISPNFQTTADGIYTNYSATLTSASNSGGLLPAGLDITMTFNRSNTSWQGVGPTPFINWRPNDTKIGSDSTVGAITNKVYLNIQNNTKKDYYFYFDASSTSGSVRQWHLTINNQLLFNWSGFPTRFDSSAFLQFSIPSFSNVILYSVSTSGQTYLDAWYLKDLGVSAAYESGVDAGYIQGQDDADLLITGFSAMVGILVNFVLMIVNLEVFGVSLIGIFSIIVLFTGIVWTLKLIRG